LPAVSGDLAVLNRNEALGAEAKARCLGHQAVGDGRLLAMLSIFETCPKSFGDVDIALCAADESG
jgi:hypothetical protein